MVAITGSDEATGGRLPMDGETARELLSAAGLCPEPIGWLEGSLLFKVHGRSREEIVRRTNFVNTELLRDQTVMIKVLSEGLADPDASDAGADSEPAEAGEESSNDGASGADADADADADESAT